jgi:hypothetical protein
MCDYSLHQVATRPAQIEDKLVTTKFKNSITRGFAAVGEPHVAVCLLPGRAEILASLFRRLLARAATLRSGHLRRIARCGSMSRCGSL